MENFESMMSEPCILLTNLLVQLAIFMLQPCLVGYVDLSWNLAPARLQRFSSLWGQWLWTLASQNGTFLSFQKRVGLHKGNPLYNPFLQPKPCFLRQPQKETHEKEPYVPFWNPGTAARAYLDNSFFVPLSNVPRQALGQAQSDWLAAEMDATEGPGPQECIQDPLKKGYDSLKKALTKRIGFP